ncbi:TVP38/TMEM64 family protein [Brachybacterium sp. DNPG3]
MSTSTGAMRPVPSPSSTARAVTGAVTGAVPRVSIRRPVLRPTGERTSTADRLGRIGRLTTLRTISLPTLPTLPQRASEANRSTARHRSTTVAEGTSLAAGSAVSEGNAVAEATALEAPVRRDPLRIAARFSPILGLLVSIGLVLWGWQSGVLQSLENLQAYIDSLGAFGPLVFLVVSIASVIFPVVPGGLLVIAGPVLFGAVEGTLLNYIAVCTGSLLNFIIARRVGLDLIERMFAPKTVEKFLGWTRSPHFARAFATAIVLPVAPDDLLCYLAGTTKMRWRTYVLIILTCKPWSLIAYGLGVSALLMKVLPW